MTEHSSRPRALISGNPEDNGWMLEELALPGIRHAVVCSRDGLPLAYPSSTPREDAERLSAACAGLATLGQGLADSIDTSSPAGAVPMGLPQEVIIKYDGGILFVRGAARNTALAVLAERTIDPGLVARQMQKQVDKIGRGMNAAVRAPGS
ncbi:roadblock/LC7 domain-containing protein [Thermomonospora catenispora]|uniref:roadblock/LC7 domain-containing protein n=1 Tax=Thermomonospora catenispora TaxID=2493090 RepID=UPI00111EF41F|nr:roadblock/LC7 domain-containing protein [Thermomonospora catenispora]TNY37587.1 roadblock/LC7 domain-containing protein [Thermomonospora catenispora]